MALDLRITRARVLFASDLSALAATNRETADAAIMRTVRVHRVHGCVEHVVGEFGDHPETAVPRMRWALALVDELY